MRAGFNDLPFTESTHMAQSDSMNTDRRTFLQAGALAATAGLSAGASAQAQAKKTDEIPRRKLGKTGVEISILEQGTVLGSGFDRILRTSYAGGVRTFDTAKVYRSENLFKKWFEQAPEV